MRVIQLDAKSIQYRVIPKDAPHKYVLRRSTPLIPNPSPARGRRELGQSIPSDASRSDLSIDLVENQFPHKSPVGFARGAVSPKCSYALAVAMRPRGVRCR